MSEPTPLELRFQERCRVMLGGALQDLPAEIASGIRGTSMSPGETWWWCSIYGTNGQDFDHPKFWDPKVSTYFISQSILNREWTVGLHFCPGQRKRCSGHIYGDTMARLMRKHDSAEGFGFSIRRNRNGTENSWLELRMPDTAADMGLRPKLAWLVRTTGPDIQAMLRANAT